MHPGQGDFTWQQCQGPEPLLVTPADDRSRTGPPFPQSRPLPRQHRGLKSRQPGPATAFEEREHRGRGPLLGTERHAKVP